MIDRPRRIGLHLPVRKGLVKAAERAVSIGASTLQVFIDNPTAWRRRPELPPELDAFQARLVAADIRPLVVHASYLINLPGPAGPSWDRSVEVLSAEIRMARAYGASLLNVHVGSHLGAGLEVGAARLAEGVRQALDAVEPGVGPRLLFENSAGSGDGMGRSVAELAVAFEALDRHGVALDGVGVCLDTAHLWGAGVDCAVPEAIDALFAECDERLGSGAVALIHLNDSRAALGSRLDRHEHLGAGRIGEVGLRHLVNHPRLADVPMVLETPGMDEGYDAINLARLRALLAGDPLPALSPEAPVRRRRKAVAAPAGA